MRHLSVLQWIAVVTATALLVAFAAFVASSQTLPAWAIVAIVAFGTSLVLYPVVRRSPAPPRDPAADRKDAK